MFQLCENATETETLLVLLSPCILLKVCEAKDMKKLTVSVGERFNKLVVVELLGVNEKGFSVVKCHCDCGSDSVVKIAELRSAHRTSCGCQSWSNRSNSKHSDIVGKRFNQLEVLRLAGKDTQGYRIAECKCDCGQWVKIRIAQMMSGLVKSCGCLQRSAAMQNLAVMHKNQTIHGMTGTLTGRSWNAAMQRCFNPRSESFYNYGSRGIKLCEFLKASPLNLVLLIGERPNAAMSLDRIDGDKGYWCGSCEECLTKGQDKNVRWATASEQALNRRGPKRLVEIDGVIKRASEWCKLLGLRVNSKKIYTYPDANDDPVEKGEDVP
jgi:hypothetical protein